MTLRTQILATAVEIAHTLGYQGVHRWRIAKRLKCSEGVVSYHFKTMPKLRDAIIAHAIETEDYKIIVQAFASRHPLALKAPEDLIRRAMSGRLGR